MLYHLRTFGCAMNTSDSERLSGVLEAVGFQATTDWQEADLIIFNTCKIRQKAEDRVFGQQENLALMRAQRPGLVVAVTGCMVRNTSFASDRPETRDPLLSKMSTLDLVFRIEDCGRLPELLKRHFPLLGDNPVQADYFSLAPKVSNRYQVLVPIMSGCNKFCTYCVVPFTRGQERSRQHSEILAEIERHVTSGAREVMLLGQNVNSYWDSEGTTFPQLLREVAAIPGLARIRFSTSHPYDCSPELIEVMASQDNICKELHLPVQSGDDGVLRLMNRHYTVASYQETLAAARRAMPELTVSTDIIVGFPGEDEAAFARTLAFYAELRFDLAYIAQFSPRSGTPAALMPYQVSAAEKERRWQELNNLQCQITLANNQKYRGQTLAVLVENVNGGIASGRTEGFKYVQFSIAETNGAISGSVRPGDIVMVKIEEPLTWVLRGQIAAYGHRRLREEAALAVSGKARPLPLVASK